MKLSPEEHEVAKEAELKGQARAFARFLLTCGRPERAIALLDQAIAEEEKEKNFGVNLWWKDKKGEPL